MIKEIDKKQLKIVRKNNKQIIKINKKESKRLKKFNLKSNNDISANEVSSGVFMSVISSLIEAICGLF